MWTSALESSCHWGSQLPPTVRGPSSAPATGDSNPEPAPTPNPEAPAGPPTPGPSTRKKRKRKGEGGDKELGHLEIEEIMTRMVSQRKKRRAHSSGPWADGAQPVGPASGGGPGRVRPWPHTARPGPNAGAMPAPAPGRQDRKGGRRMFAIVLTLPQDCQDCPSTCMKHILEVLGE